MDSEWWKILSILVGFAGVAITIGVTVGRTRSELHFMGIQISDGFKRNDDDHGVMQKLQRDANGRLAVVETKVAVLDERHGPPQ